MLRLASSWDSIQISQQVSQTFLLPIPIFNKGTKCTIAVFTGVLKKKD